MSEVSSLRIANQLCFVFIRSHSADVQLNARVCNDRWCETCNQVKAALAAPDVGRCELFRGVETERCEETNSWLSRFMFMLVIWALAFVN